MRRTSLQCRPTGHWTGRLMNWRTAEEVRFVAGSRLAGEDCAGSPGAVGTRLHGCPEEGIEHAHRGGHRGLLDILGAGLPGGYALRGSDTVAITTTATTGDARELLRNPVTSPERPSG